MDVRNLKTIQEDLKKVMKIIADKANNKNGDSIAESDVDKKAINKGDSIAESDVDKKAINKGDSIAEFDVDKKAINNEEPMNVSDDDSSERSPAKPKSDYRDCNDTDPSLMKLVDEKGFVNQKALDVLTTLLKGIEGKVDDAVAAATDKDNEDDSQTSEEQPKSLPLPSEKVQIFIPVRTKMTEKFPSEAKRYLFKGMWSKMSVCYDYDKLCEEQPLIVVCPILSRVQSDINSALEHMKYNKPFVVLLLYSGVESSLPQVSTSSKLDMNKYRNIEFIDIALTTDNKVYRCSINERAKQTLKDKFDSGAKCWTM